MSPESNGTVARASYDDASRARWIPEAPKRPGRSPFERDRARVLHSSALRRLSGKTQVVGPDEGDFPRTRLTHSLECAQVGRELGQALGCDPDLVETACLAHDLGHPPFGHNGESALDEAARDCGGFEGNAQSLRILTRLEAKTFVPAGRSVGLNLTRAAIDAAMKYPWPHGGSAASATDAPSSDEHAFTGDEHTLSGGAGTTAPDTATAEAARTRRPYGAYREDLDVFAWVRQGAPPGRACLEAQIMDWADDVAYSVHDLEDGVFAGHVELAALRDRGQRRRVCEFAASRYAPEADPRELHEAFERLLALPYWPAGYDGTQRSLAALKDMTSQLIGRFCAAAEWGTRRCYGSGPLHRYDAELIVPRGQLLECAVLKGITACYVMSRVGAAQLRARQREMLAELVDALWRRAPDALDPALRAAFASAGGDTARLRVIIDQVAALTDVSALSWHRRLAPRGREFVHGH